MTAAWRGGRHGGGCRGAETNDALAVWRTLRLNAGWDHDGPERRLVRLSAA